MSKARSRKARILKAARRSSSSFAGQQTEAARLRRERDEALERETATTEVLRLISKSPGNLGLVFRSILENATRICQANFANLHFYEGDTFRVVAMHNAPPEWAEVVRQREPVIHARRPHPLARLAATKQFQHIADARTEALYLERDPQFTTFVDAAGARSVILVPMLKEEQLIGTIAIYRQEVRPFTDKQIELLQNFASQAVIAIENTRLLNELRQRTADLSESLEQQTATSEVLKVISSSPGELEPVFKAMLENATRLCEAKFGNMLLLEGDVFRYVALHGASPEFSAERQRDPIIRPKRGAILDRLLKTRQAVQVADVLTEGGTDSSAIVTLAGARTILMVPMLKHGDLIGGLGIYRQEVRPFTDKQIALVSNFAAQAVIAIENARLLNELRESLEQQTATADVLRVISSSPGELKPVFDTILENATRICQAKFGVLCSYDGNLFKYAAVWNAPPAFLEFVRQRGSFAPRAGTPLDRILKTKNIIHRADASVDEVLTDTARLAGAKSHLTVPMFKDEALVGAIIIYRQEVRPFGEKQIALVQNFAAQAVIAIENARLLNELRESLQQQTATSEVLRVISSSPGELEPVFESALANATGICEAKFGSLYLYDGEKFRVGALHNAPAAFAEFRRREPIFHPPVGTGLAHVVATKQTVHTPDITLDKAYIDRNPIIVAGVELGGFRTVLTVPMIKDENLIGCINIYRQEVQPFTDKQIALVQNFAAQAVIAIENARLLNELRESLEQQTATSEVLKIIAGSPGKLEPVFSEILESATAICEAKFGTLFLYDDNTLRVAAGVGTPLELAEFERQRGSFRPELGSRLERIVGTKQVVHIVDDAAEDDPSPPTRLAGARSIVFVPMLKDDVLIGAIAIYRQEVRAFTDKQIALLVNFAAQAVIAIENTRLLNELRESLGRQTATAEVLRVISSSRGDLAPIFYAILENATRICEATFGSMLLRDGDVFRRAALHNAPPQFEEFIKTAAILRRGMAPSVDHAIDTGQVSHTLDAAAEEPNAPIARYAGARTLLDVPMLKGSEAIGILGIYRQEVRPFTDKQIALVQNFAAQAVIAIENARLLNELRQRTTDLSEALEQQTATSEVLRVISSSPGDLTPVFNAMLENATKLCGAEFGLFYLDDGDLTRIAAAYNVPSALAATQNVPFRVHPKSGLAELRRTKRVVPINDIRAMPPYLEGDPRLVAMADLGGARTTLGVPLVKDNNLVGAIVIYRQEVLPFTDKQIELVKNFAAQAVIAIENARLLNELRESLQQQTATSEVLKVISSSPANIQPVLDIIGERAEKLCDADISMVSIVDGDLIRLASLHGVAEAGVEAVRRTFPMRLTDETVTARAIRTRSVCHLADVLSDPQYQVKRTARLSGTRGGLGVPMVRDDQVVGAIFVSRKQPGLFSDAQVQLLKTFADQAVIAIENVRLFNETKNSLEQQTATADVLKIISRSAFDLRAVLQTLVESAARFCNADKANIIRERDGGFYTAEGYGYSREFMDYIQKVPITAERGSASGRALVEGRLVHIADVKADPEYTLVEAQRLGDYRTALGVPMLREGAPIGVLTLTRSQVQPFTDKQIELVTTFADQAAIAIENVRLFDEIQDKSRQLEVASQHKSQFLANMSHELRTPLNAILGYTELMADGAYGEPSEKMLGILKRLEANGRHLLGLINDVLDLSKIEAGQLVLELSDYSIQDIAQTVRSTLEPLATDKKLAFKVEVAPKLPAGRGDGRRLTQVLINLVGNAIKFTDTGEVAIKAEANNGSFLVSVRDTGPGISSADQAKLFQEFQQADNAITKKKGGTGLGLAISKRIIEMHGGRIWVESQPGQGSTFTFTLPVIVERQVEAA